MKTKTQLEVYKSIRKPFIFNASQAHKDKRKESLRKACRNKQAFLLPIVVK